MPVEIVRVTRDELEAQRTEILARLGVSLGEIVARAEAYTLTPELDVAWQELGEIAFLLGEVITDIAGEDRDA